MNDGQRIYPVKYLVLHHSTGPEFPNASDLQVQDWFDRIGKSRGYRNYSRSYHLHPQRNKETFAQAHYALRLYDADHNRYGWRITPLMKDSLHNVAWHAGNWRVNQQSIGLEVCGNYLNKLLPEKALWVIADYFRDYDRSIGGNLEVLGHKEVAPTACPGRILEQKGEIIRLFNQGKFMTQIEDKLKQTQGQLNTKEQEIKALKNKLSAQEQRIKALEKNTGNGSSCSTEKDEIDRLRKLSRQYADETKELKTEVVKYKKIALKYKARSQSETKDTPDSNSSKSLFDLLSQGLKKFFRNNRK